jgi:hypothetical protein
LLLIGIETWAVTVTQPPAALNSHNLQYFISIFLDKNHRLQTVTLILPLIFQARLAWCANPPTLVGGSLVHSAQESGRKSALGLGSVQY